MPPKPLTLCLLSYTWLLLNMSHQTTHLLLSLLHRNCAQRSWWGKSVLSMLTTMVYVHTEPEDWDRAQAIAYVYWCERRTCRYQILLFPNPIYLKVFSFPFAFIRFQLVVDHCLGTTSSCHHYSFHYELLREGELNFLSKRHQILVCEGMSWWVSCYLEGFY